MSTRPRTRTNYLRRNHFGLATAVLAAAVGCGRSPDAEVTGGAGSVVVRNAWARPAAGPNAAAYLTLVNRGPAVVSIVGAGTPAGTGASLHESVQEEGGAHPMAHMVPLAQVSVAPGDSAVLAPGGRHIMLEGLRAPLVAGGQIELVLVAADGNRYPATVSVRAP